MTQTSSRLMDEFAKLMTDAAGVAQGVRREAETAVRGQVERFLADMDLVQREDFEAVRDMAAKAREENEALKAQVAALQDRLGALEGKTKPAARGARRTAAKTAKDA